MLPGLLCRRYSQRSLQAIAVSMISKVLTEAFQMNRHALAEPLRGQTPSGCDLECLACRRLILTAFNVSGRARCSYKVLAELLLDVNPAAAAVIYRALTMLPQACALQEGQQEAVLDTNAM